MHIENNLLPNKTADTDTFNTYPTLIVRVYTTVFLKMNPRVRNT